MTSMYKLRRIFHMGSTHRHPDDQGWGEQILKQYEYAINLYYGLKEISIDHTKIQRKRSTDLLNQHLRQRLTIITSLVCSQQNA